MSRQLDEALVEALDQIDQGVPVAEIVSQYPEMADELESFLATAADLEEWTAIVSPIAQQASKRAFLKAAARLHDDRGKTGFTRLRQLFLSGLAVLLLLVGSASVLVVLSTRALPGDSLYGTKLYLEAARLNYSANPDAAADMIDAFSQERLREVERLLSLGRSAEVIFRGQVDQISSENWVVEGIPVTITSSTLILDNVEVGSEVRISGRTNHGSVLADEIEVFSGFLPQPEVLDPNLTLKPTPLPIPTRLPLNTPERPPEIQSDNERDAILATDTPPPLITPESGISNEDRVEPNENGNPGIVEDDDNSGGQQEENEPGDSNAESDQGNDSSQNVSSEDGNRGDQNQDQKNDGDATPEGEEHSDDEDHDPEETKEPEKNDSNGKEEDSPDESENK